MKRINHHLTEQQIARLNALAQNTGLTVAEHVRRAIDEYLLRPDVSQLSIPIVSKQNTDTSP